MRIIDPYREENERHFRWLESLSQKKAIELLKDIGILDEHGHLAARYRDPEEPSPKRKKGSRARKPATPRRTVAASKPVKRARRRAAS